MRAISAGGSIRRPGALVCAHEDPRTIIGDVPDTASVYTLIIMGTQASMLAWIIVCIAVGLRTTNAKKVLQRPGNARMVTMGHDVLGSCSTCNARARL